MWEYNGSKFRAGGDFEYSDGILEGGNVCGGAFVVGRDGSEKEVECGVGDIATVWDREVAAEGLASVPLGGGRVLILAHSRAAIAAIRRQARREKQYSATCGRW